MDKLKDVDNETIKRFLEFIEKEKGKKYSEITIALCSLFLYTTKITSKIIIYYYSLF